MTGQSPQCEAHFSSIFDRSRVVSAGSTAIIERLACGHVRKIPYPNDCPRERSASLRDIAREHQVYARIVNQPHFLEMVEYSPEQGIVLQGMPDGTLRDHLQSQGALISPSQRLSWAYDVSAAVHTLHATGVVHGDLKPENVLLDERLGVFLIDFSGSSVNEQQVSAWESVRFFMPRSVDTDLTYASEHFRPRLDAIRDFHGHATVQRPSRRDSRGAFHKGRVSERRAYTLRLRDKELLGGNNF